MRRPQAGSGAMDFVGQAIGASRSSEADRNVMGAGLGDAGERRARRAEELRQAARDAGGADHNEAQAAPSLASRVK